MPKSCPYCDSPLVAVHFIIGGGVWCCESKEFLTLHCTRYDGLTDADKHRMRELNKSHPLHCIIGGSGFRITQAELDQWFDGVWAQFGEDSVRRRDATLEQKVHREFTGTICEGLGWTFPNDLIEYDGPAAGNGAGFTIWYDAQTETAFQRGGYW